jgi:hypothetical protein
VLSVLTSVAIDCVVVVSCGLTPLQCTTLDLTLLAEQYLSDPSQSPSYCCCDYLATPDYLVVKVQGGWPARLDTPIVVIQVRAKH